MAYELKCDCGTRPSPTEVWTEIPDKCETCGKQVLVRVVTKAEKDATWKKDK